MGQYSEVSVELSSRRKLTSRLSRSAASTIIFVGYNDGCKAIQRLAEKHANFMSKFGGGVQILGPNYIPDPPKAMRQWYLSVSGRGSVYFGD